jgi:hypothetical protein
LYSTSSVIRSMTVYSTHQYLIKESSSANP